MKPSFPVLAVICGLLLFPHCAFSETKSQAKEREAAEQQRLQRKVTKVLQGERMGVIPDRQKALKTLIESGNAPDEAYWQAGYIKKGDQWVSVEQRFLTVEQEAKLDEYAKVRNPAWNTPEANYELAKWCDQHGLHEQARAHLMSILLDHPDNAQLRQMLGYQKIGNRWMNEEEFNAAVEAAERLAKNLQKWGPVVSEIRAGLDSGDTRKQNEARVKLEQIDDLDAIPAFELILLTGSEQAAAACVAHLSSIKYRKATLALCNAVLSMPDGFHSAREAAITEIKIRPMEDYIPIVLGKMQTPLTGLYSFTSQTGLEFSHGPFNLPQKYEIWKSIERADIKVSNESFHEIRYFSFGVIFNNTTLHIEMVNRNGDIALPIFNEMNEHFPRNTVPGIRDVIKWEWANRYSIRDVQLAEIDYVIQMSRMIESQNDVFFAYNQKAGWLLSQVTGQSQHEQPQFWWSWWKRQIEVDTRHKLVRNIDEVIEFSPEFHIPSSCFIAGTPVWTDRGPHPIEKLQIGDRVLTKDVETGELSYKPIIRATVREPNPLVTINLGPEQITSTGGHPFWVSGTGWVRARELKPGQRLHTPTGSIEIESVTEADERETYNLVVDGFHTYFVGQSQLLCHDVSITSPTDAVVPGLIER